MKICTMPMVKHVNDEYITYSVLRNRGIYRLSVCTDRKGAYSVIVDDVARDLVTAKRILVLFANNLVFPENVLEIFDDILGA